MNKEKIIQIIPAPAGMYVKYAGECNGEEYEYYAPVVCLALMENQLGSRYIQPMSINADGYIEKIDKSVDFDSIVWKEEPNE